nr:hypothetical protein [Tanacetum cinerariifolium]
MSLKDLKLSNQEREIVTHWFTLIVLSALRPSNNENMLSLVNPYGFAGNIKGEWRYLFPAEPQFITTCSYPAIKTSATLMYSNRKLEFMIEFDDETRKNMTIYGDETIKLNGFELINDVIAKSEGGFNVSSFMNEAISKGFKRAFGIVWSETLVMDFWNAQSWVI